MYGLIKYLKFQWQAKSLHAIHSPFLFHFLKQAVHRNVLPHHFRHSLHGQHNLLLRILYYFHFKSIYLNAWSEDFKTLIDSYQQLEPDSRCISSIKPENIDQNFDVYILNDLKSIYEGQVILNKMNSQKHNFVIIPQLRASKLQLDFFKSLLQENNSLVILEFYSFALLIDRKESSSEYFKIRKWGAF